MPPDGNYLPRNKTLIGPAVSPQNSGRPQLTPPTRHFVIISGRIEVEKGVWVNHPEFRDHGIFDEQIHARVIMGGNSVVGRYHHRQATNYQSYSELLQSLSPLEYAGWGIFGGEKLKLDRWALIAEIVGSFAIVVTLVILLFEVRGVCSLFAG